MNNNDNINQEISLYNEELEQEIIGYLIIEPNFYEEIGEIDSNWFYFENNKTIFNSIISMIQKNEEVNETTLYHILENKKIYKNSEDLKNYLKLLVDLAISSISNAKTIAKLLRDLYIKRNLITVKSKISEYIQKEENIFDVIPKLESDLYSIANFNRKNEPKLINDFNLKIKERLKDAIKSDEKVQGVKTSFVDIDKHFGGFKNSELIILAARPSMGKTALAVNIAVNVARNFFKKKENKSVIFFSLEMSGEQITSRIISSETNIQSKTIQSGIKEDDEKIKDLTDKEFIKVCEAIDDFEKLPLFIDDTAGISIANLIVKARRLKRRHNLGMVIVDYLQLIHSSKYTNNRILEISEITQGLKNLAKELDIPVIALSQLSRAVESSERKDKRPKLSDLRESGTIEQDADIVTFLYREAYYLERDLKINEEAEDVDMDNLAFKNKLEKVKNEAELIVAKNRNGPIGVIKLFYNSNYTKFGNISKNEDRKYFKNNSNLDKIEHHNSDNLEDHENKFLKALKAQVNKD